MHLLVQGLLVVEFGLGEESLGKGGAVVVGSFESTNELRLDAQVTEFLNGGFGSLGLDGLVLSQKSFSAGVVGLSVLHPVDGEQVTEAGADVGAIDVGVGATVGSPGAEGGVGGSHGEDVLGCVEIGEHGARLAGLKVEDELLEHAGVLHRLKGAVELISVDPVTD